MAARVAALLPARLVWALPLPVLRLGLLPAIVALHTRVAVDEATEPARPGSSTGHGHMHEGAVQVVTVRSGAAAAAQVQSLSQKAGSTGKHAVTCHGALLLGCCPGTGWMTGCPAADTCKIYVS